MNQPLTAGNFTVFQSSFDEAGHGRESSTFSVAYDPGRAWKYAGSLTICLGIAMHVFDVRVFLQEPQAGCASQLTRITRQGN